MEYKQYQLETITPVCISSGEKLSPITDFFIEDNHIHIVDQIKLDDEIRKKQLMNKYIQKIHQTKDNENFKLKLFIENHLGDANHYIKYSIPYLNQKGYKQTHLQTHIKTNDSLYIPGTSFKGAIKSALFYHWLTNNKEGEKALNAIIEFLKKKVDKGQLKKEWNKLEEKYLQHKDSDGRFLFSDLSISDSDPITEESPVVFYTQRIHMKNKQGIPQLKECINKNEKATFRMKADNFNLTQSLNRFAYNAILTEQEILEDEAKGFVDAAVRPQLNSFYENILDDIDALEHSNSNTYYLRIGSGKSYFDNSVGMAIFERDKDAFFQLRKTENLGKAPGEKNFKPRFVFPITRSLIDQTFEPTGWIKIGLNQ